MYNIIRKVFRFSRNGLFKKIKVKMIFFVNFNLDSHYLSIKKTSY